MTAHLIRLLQAELLPEVERILPGPAVLIVVHRLARSSRKFRCREPVEQKVEQRLFGWSLQFARRKYRQSAVLDSCCFGQAEQPLEMLAASNCPAGSVCFVGQAQTAVAVPDHRLAVAGQGLAGNRRAANTWAAHNAVVYKPADGNWGTNRHVTNSHRMTI